VLVGALPALYVALRSVNRTWPLVAGLVAAVALMADINSGLWVYALPDLGNASVAATTAARAGYTASGQLLYSSSIEASHTWGSCSGSRVSCWG